MPVANQRTHGTTFRALKVTSQVATPGAESAVYDFLVPCVDKRIGDRQNVLTRALLSAL